MKRTLLVFGNSWQLNLLTKEEREFIDSYPYVYTLNGFLSHWKLLGFRPAVWVMGDNHAPGCCVSLRTQLEYAMSDEVLLEKLRRVYIGKEAYADEALRVRNDSGIWKRTDAKMYSRGFWTDTEQPVNRLIGDKVFHYASTITDLVHLAWLEWNFIGEEVEVRICGCQHGKKAGHFYPSPVNVDVDFEWFIEHLWIGMKKLLNNGIHIVDCNIEHDEPQAEILHSFERKPLLEGLV